MSARLFLLLYLLRDTLHRWSKRISSPLSRLLVVLSLSFCGLLFLSNYALSIRMLEDKITASGADLLVTGEFFSGEKVAKSNGRSFISPVEGECNLYIFNDLFVPAKVANTSYSIVEYSPELVKLLPKSSNAIYLLPAIPTEHSSPVDISVEEYTLKGITLSSKQEAFLRKIYTNGAIFIPKGNFSLSSFTHGSLVRHVLQFKKVDVETVTRWEQMLSLISRLDERSLTIVSSRQMLQELEQLKQLQYRFRMGIVLGCCFIIGLLLTSISSMEFRQNEYVYALMGSFGISRLCLFMTFVAENTLLVFIAFASALLGLINTGPYLVEKLYKMQGYIFSLEILQEDIYTFIIAFTISIPVSCLPILGAIFRPIGKILK